MGMSSYLEPRFKSLPIPVEFAGWRSNTFYLQKCGWNFHVRHDPAKWAYEFILTNEHLRLGGLSELWDSPEAYCVGKYMDQKHIPPIQVHRVVSVDHTTIICNTRDPYVDFMAVDMKPSHAIDQYRLNLGELFPFNLKGAPEVPEIALETQADMEVVDYLQAILDDQQDKQAEIRKRKSKAVDRVEITELQPKFRIVI